MRLFYLSDLDERAAVHQLPEEEAKHIIRVLRMRAGDEVGLVNGNGLLIRGKISTIENKRCSVETVEVIREDRTEKPVHIAVAPTKNADRMEWLVEKMTEIGVTKISFVHCSNSERKHFRQDRVEKIMVAACKQSKRLYFPELESLVSFEEFIRRYPAGAIAHCYDERDRNDIGMTEANGKPVLIGPEGDFTEAEVQMALDSGYMPISLGKNRLRTETAALYACVILKSTDV